MAVVVVVVDSGGEGVVGLCVLDPWVCEERE